MDSDSKKYLAIGGAVVAGGTIDLIQFWAYSSSRTKFRK